MQGSRRGRVVVFWALIMALALTPLTGAQQRPGVVMGVGEIGVSPDPHMSVILAAQPIFRALYDGLTVVDHTGQLQPALAQAWRTVSPTVWEFALRRGVKFSNGETVTAADVKFSFDRVLDPKTKSPVRGRVGIIKEVSVVEPLTVRITTESPYALLLRAIVVVPIIPARYFAQVGEDGFNRKPVGTGAFELVAFERGSFARLRARTDSWRGVPAAGELFLRVVRDPAVRVAALKTGEIDVAVEVPTDNVPELRASGRRIVTGKGARVMQFGLYCRGVLQDKRVRQALNHAIDKEAIIKNIYGGFGELSQGQLVTRGAGGFSSKVKAYPFDPEKAKALLKAAGLERGFTLKIAFAPGRYLNDKALVEAVTGYLAKAGVKVELQIMEAAVLSQTLYAGKIENALLTVFGYAPVMDIDFPANYFTSPHPFQVGCRDKKFDALYAEAKGTLDTRKRQALLEDAAAILREEAWTIFLFEPLDVFAVKTSITKFDPHPGFLWWSDSVGR